MQRRFSTRDPELTARMAMTLVCAAALYVVVIGAVAWGAVALGRLFPILVIPVAVIIVVTVGRFRSTSGLALQAVAARLVDESSEPDLYRSIGRLAALADVPMPRVAVIDTAELNAFTIGLRPARSTIAVTAGLRQTLSEQELEGVLAHELAHVANRDAAVMTIATVPRTLGETVIREDGAIFFLWWPLYWLAVPIWAVGSLLTLTLSRYREFTADRGSAMITGQPEELMSALQKIAGANERIPHSDLRQLSAVEALCVVSRGHTRISLFSDHPPLQKRLERLAEISREIGKPD